MNMGRSTALPLENTAAAIPLPAPVSANPATGAVPLHRKKLDSLTSLRFFAAALVVVGHVSPLFRVHYSLLNGFLGGQGVTFFYVLSGFILTYSYPVLDRAGTRRFFVARLARIWPMHLAAILLLVLLVVVGQNAVLDPVVVGLNIFLLQAWVPIPHYYSSFNPIAWSVSVELFFYACFPLLIRNWRRTWALKLGVTLLMTAGMTALYNYGQRFLPQGADVSGVVYYNPLARLFEFTVGVTTAQIWLALRDRLRLSRAVGTLLELGALALVFFISAGSIQWAYQIQSLPFLRLGGFVWLSNGGMLVLPFALLVLILALEAGWVSRVLAFLPLVILGEISYSIYLTHSTFLGYYLDHQERFRVIPDNLLWPAFWVVLLASCFVFWSLIELPSRHAIVAWYDHHFGGQTRRSLPARAPDTAARSWVFRLAASPIVHAALVASVLALSLAGIMYRSEAQPSVTGRTRTADGVTWYLSVNGTASGTGIGGTGPTAVSHVTEPLVVGWAIDQTNHRLVQSVEMLIDGTMTFPLKYGQANEILAKQLGDPQYLRGGFKGTIPSRHLTMGDHIVTLRVFTGDAHTYFESHKFGITVT